jgi:hypothetical protein
VHVIQLWGLTKSYESDEIDYHASNQSIGYDNFQLPQSLEVELPKYEQAHNGSAL